MDTWRYHDSRNNESDKELQEKDEIMSYVALLHITAVVRFHENIAEYAPESTDRPCGLLMDDGDGIQALLSFFRKFE